MENRTPAHLAFGMMSDRTVEATVNFPRHPIRPHLRSAFLSSRGSQHLGLPPQSQALTVVRPCSSIANLQPSMRAKIPTPKVRDTPFLPPQSCRKRPFYAEYPV